MHGKKAIVKIITGTPTHTSVRKALQKWRKRNNPQNTNYIDNKSTTLTNNKSQFFQNKLK